MSIITSTAGEGSAALTIFIPMLATRAGAAFAEIVDAGSAIVGRTVTSLADLRLDDALHREADRSDSVEVYFEGNRRETHPRAAAVGDFKGGAGFSWPGRGHRRSRPEAGRATARL